MKVVIKRTVIVVSLKVVKLYFSLKSEWLIVDLLLRILLNAKIRIKVALK